MKLTATLAIGLLSAAASAQTVAPDTLSNITDATSVTITETPEQMNVRIVRVNESDTITELFSRSLDNKVVRQRRWNTSPLSAPVNGVNSKFDLCIGGPGIGWTNAVGQPDGLGIEMGKSLDISWLNMISVKYHLKRATVSVGVGFDWRNYRISTSSHRFTMSPEGTVTVTPYPKGAKAHGSRLKVFSIGIPVLWTQSLPFRWIDGNWFTITAGAVFNYSPHASLLAKWTTADGQEASERTSHIGHRRFSIDFIGMMKLGWGLNAYVRYSPNTVLRGAGQPRFRPFSTGLIFLF